MPYPPPADLSALVGSRICHDLINPLGAIGNGIELLDLAGLAVAGEEMALVSGSVRSATARLQFLRFAFGDATADQRCANRDLSRILQDVAQDGRHDYSWQVPDDPSRYDVRVALLSLMCIETALPLGGEIQVTQTDTTWTVEAQHDRLNLDPELWVPLSQGVCPPEICAAKVHFGLLPQMAQIAGRRLVMTHGSDWVKIRF